MSSVSKNQEMSPQVADVVNGVGDFIEYWGFKKIHGKIWALIFLSERPVDANFLIANLGVSKALVSMSLKDLLAYNVILESEEKRSTQHYVSNPNMADVILEVLMGREAKMLMKIKSACEMLECVENKKLKPEVTDARIKKLSQMVSAADKTLKTFVGFKQFNFLEVSKTLNLGQSGE